MEEECRENDARKWWAEYEYIVLQAAREKGKTSLTGESIVRDRGHAGM